MGRRPIGEQAMTATERQRRWRAKKRVIKAGPQPAALTAPVGQLQTRIHQLEIERAVLRTEIEKLHAEVSRFMHAWAGSWILNKARVHELETELAGERREAPVDPDTCRSPSARSSSSRVNGRSARSKTGSGRKPTDCLTSYS